MKVNKSNKLWIAVLLAVVVPAGSNLLAEDYPGFYVDGRFLYDKCGERVILRGTDVMTAWWDYGGATTFPELAKTGANCARIFWQVDQYLPPAHLDATIQNCINNDMIPMVGLWNATCDWSQLQNCVNYWTSPSIVAVVQKHEQYFLLNIANEPGDSSVTDQQYRDAMASAITQIRNAGIICPLVLDPAGCGRGENYIFNNAEYLIDFDPLHNLIFDWHPWDAVPEGGSAQRIKTAIDTAISLNICFIIGEFADKGVDLSRRTEWEYIMRYTVEHDIGYLPWVWWCCGTPAGGHSIVYDKIYGHWNLPWGEEVAIKSPYSIAGTAVRPASIVNGSCGPPVFTTRKPLPVDDANGIDRNINLHWFAGHGATSSDVYFGADSNTVAAADHNSFVFKGNLGVTTFDLDTLPYNTTYYWAIDAVNDISTFPGDVWQFTTGKFDPNVTYDRVDNNYNNWGSSSLTFDHYLGAGDNRIVIVGLAAEDESATNLQVTSVTYNGVAMTPVDGSTITVGTTMLQRTDMYYILDSVLPGPGTYVVRVQRAGGVNEMTAGAISLFNVKQQPPEAVATNSNVGQFTISTGITTLSNYAWIVDVVGCGESGEFWAASTGMLRRWLKESGYGTPLSSAAAGTMPAATAGLKTVTWNHPDNTDQNDQRLAHSVATFAPAPPSYRLGDLNRDHAVDSLDVGVFAEQWLDTGGCSGSPDCADLNGSGRVDFRDFALMGENWRM
jgi:hypothetical protein